MYSLDTNLVSVIIPTYNRADFLPHAIGSVWSQTYRPLEVLIIDDGSLDNTAEIIKQIQARYNCNDFLLRYFHQENKGGSAARNLGINKSHGEYIQFLDSDDLLAPQKIELQMRMLQESGCDGAYGSWRLMYDYGMLRYGPMNQAEAAPSEDFMLRGYLSARWFLPPHCYLFLRNVVLKTGPWDETLHHEEDADYLIRMLIKGSRFLYVPYSHVYYRRHARSNVSSPQVHDSSLFQRNIMARFKIRSKAYRLLKEKNKTNDYNGEFENWSRQTATLAAKYGNVIKVNNGEPGLLNILQKEQQQVRIGMGQKMLYKILRSKSVYNTLRSMGVGCLVEWLTLVRKNLHAIFKKGSYTLIIFLLC